MGSWDSEIDEVARSMTEGRPGALFTAQVLARLDETAARTTSSGVVWMGLTGAVAAAFVLAIVMVRVPWRPDSVDLTSGTHEISGPVRGTPESVGRPSEHADSGGPSPHTTSAIASPPYPSIVPSGSQTVLTKGEADARRVQTLAIAPIRVDRLDVDPMETTVAIQVPALDVPILEVPTLAAIARLDIPAMADD